MKYPFLYVTYDEKDLMNEGPCKYVVVLFKSYSFIADYSWGEKDDPAVYNGKQWWKMKPCLIDSSHEFDTINEAYKFIAKILSEINE